MIEPQIKRGTTRDEYTRQTRVVWRLYYFTGESWQMPMTWTCDTRAEARWLAFTHQWIRIAGTMIGIPEREVGRLIVESHDYKSWLPAPAGTGQRCGAANACHLHKGHPGQHEDWRGDRWGTLTSKAQSVGRANDAGPAARAVVGDAEDAAQIARPVMRLAEQETFVALYLTVRNTLIGDPQVVAIGSLTGVEVCPRDVFRGAIAANAAGVIVLHNHPSGDPTPSAEDIALTRRLKACGDLLGVPLVDHVVVTADRFASIAEMLGGTL